MYCREGFLKPSSSSSYVYELPNTLATPTVASFKREPPDSSTNLKKPNNYDHKRTKITPPLVTKQSSSTSDSSRRIDQVVVTATSTTTTTANTNYSSLSNQCFYSIQLFNDLYKKTYVNSTSSDVCVDPETGIQVRLESNSLWSHFSSIGTEMIITKCGR